MKRTLALFLALLMALALVPTAAFAATSEESGAAQALYDLGLFQGTGSNADGTPNFDLDRTPTRAEAVTMLVRLLGKDAEAKAGTWETPFTDVADWAKPYVGYAYANGLTTGTSDTTFGSEDPINATQYLTFVLRALGYTSGTDFQWDSAWTKSDEINLTERYYSAVRPSITRGGVARISETALYMKGKGEDKSLGEKMGKFELLEPTPENLKGIWKERDFDGGELIFNSNTCQSIAKGTIEGRPYIFYLEGEFTVADGSAEWLWRDVYSCDSTGDGSKSYSFNKQEGLKDELILGGHASSADAIAHFNDGTYVLRNAGYAGNPYIKVEKSELLDEGLKVMAAYKAENPTYDEKKEVVETLDRLTDVAQTTLSSLKLALTAAQALTLGNITGMRASERAEVEASMEAGVKGTKLGCGLIGDNMKRLKEILENKSGADALVAKIDNLIDLCDSVQTTNFSVTNYETFVDRTIDVTDSLGEIMNLFTNEYLN